MAKRRFSKAQTIEFLETQMIALETVHGFRRDDGFAVCANKSAATNRAFGRYDAFRDLVEMIDDGDL